MFTVVDLSQGYYHSELDEASPFLTTSNAPSGRFRFTRMPFGLTLTVDASQHKLDITTWDVCTDTEDDMIIRGEEADGRDHDKH